MNEKSQNQSLFSNQQLKELSKPSLLTLLKYVDSIFKEKEGEILALPDVGLTPFQRQAMLAREIELLIERDGQATLGGKRFRVFGYGKKGLNKTHTFFSDNGWVGVFNLRELGHKHGAWTITPGKEGE